MPTRTRSNLASCIGLVLHRMLLLQVNFRRSIVLPLLPLATQCGPSMKQLPLQHQTTDTHTTQQHPPSITAISNVEAPNLPKTQTTWTRLKTSTAPGCTMARAPPAIKSCAKLLLLPPPPPAPARAMLRAAYTKRWRGEICSPPSTACLILPATPFRLRPFGVQVRPLSRRSCRSFPSRKTLIVSVPALLGIFRPCVPRLRFQRP